MSNTLLEAMASELPVIGTNAGGTPEVIENGVSGWLFEPGDDRALAELLDPLLRKADFRGDAGRASRRRVEEDFSLRRMISDYERLYLDLARRRSPNRGNRNDKA
jgi:glycosyltransferase involved in cell wall biosynthesis